MLLEAVALDLVTAAQTSASGLIFVDTVADDLDHIAAAARFFAPDLEVLVLPPWDTLPYDRLAPSAAIAGRRVATLARLSRPPTRPWLMLTSARACMEKAAPADHWSDKRLVIEPGTQVADVIQTLQEFGYVHDDRVDQPGDLTVRPHILDIFPGDRATPLRITIEDGRATAIHDVDPATQRSRDTWLNSAVILPVQDLDWAGISVSPDASAHLVPPLSYGPQADLMLAPGVSDRWAELFEQVTDAHAIAKRLQRAGGPRYLPPPERLFVAPTALPGRPAAVPSSLGAGQAIAPRHLVSALRADIARAPHAIVVAGGHRTAASLAKRLDMPLAADWTEAASGSCIVVGPLQQGFERPGLAILAVPAAPKRVRADMILEEPPRIGDVVVHADHGIGRLCGLEAVGDEERVALGFAEGAERLIPVDELDQVWRYGSDAGGVSLDRLESSAWEQRRSRTAAEIASTAAALVAEASRRAQLTAPVITPAADQMGRFERRFPHALSPDQRDGIDAVLADLESGRPMDRLICGDVGFGKTEIALRAAAACVFSGWQVAVVAPTTVLARQHATTFARRFAGLGVEIGTLMRGTGGAEVRHGIASGAVNIAIGTQALAAKDVRFAKLGLVVIDEEQRFGEAQKQRLARLSGDGSTHVLVMSATPIPRTLQTAMAGLRPVSLIMTPPVRRQHVRTFVAPWDGVLVREALMREHAAGGQSFCVCPRVGDLDAVAASLAQLVPELSVVVAHGKLKPADLDARMDAFVEGRHDVLLATDIIEAGLDIPRANTILITSPERFGLSQLHQMRGRVGRGTRRGFAYLLTRAGETLPPPTLRRLRTIEAQSQLGSGVAISLADLDARGAGDLFGDKQAGHVHAIGTELYQQLLADALAVARGEAPSPKTPVLHAEITGRIPAELVPETDTRLELYRRLVRLEPGGAARLAEEMADRFGELPQAVLTLLDLARLRAWCRTHGVLRAEAGPEAIALTLSAGAAPPPLAGAVQKGERLIVPIAIADPAARLAALLEVLGAE